MNNTVVFITALRLEFDEVVAHIDNQNHQWLAGRDSTTGNYGPWQVVVYLQTEPGNDEAMLVTNAAIQKDNPSYLFFVGVAGGIKDVKVGDVVIARKIIGYESAKVGDNHFKARPDVEKLPKPLARLASHIITKKEWVKKIADPNPLPQAHLSPIASGQKVIVSKEFLKQLESFAGDAVAVEMEGIGFSRAIADGAMVLQGIVIRGISDLCDPDKTAEKDKERQPIAARHAAAFAFAMLDELAHSVMPMQNITLPQPDKKCHPWLKSATWCILTAISGLLQVWFVLVIHYIILGTPLPSKKLFMDGALLFFSTAIVSSLTFDYYYLPQKEVLLWGNAFKQAMFVAFPLLIVLSALILFVVCYLLDIYAPEIKINQPVVSAVEWGVISATLIYAFIIKLVTFKLDCGEHN